MAIQDRFVLSNYAILATTIPSSAFHIQTPEKSISSFQEEVPAVAPIESIFYTALPGFVQATLYGWALYQGISVALNVRVSTEQSVQAISQFEHYRREAVQRYGQGQYDPRVEDAELED